MTSVNRAERTHQLAVLREQRRDRVMELAAAGLTTRQIASALEREGTKVDYSTVSRDITRRLSEAAQNCPNTPRYRQLQLMRVNRLMTTYYPRAVAGHAEAMGHVRWLLEREAKLLGLDSPIQQEVSLTGGPQRIQVEWYDSEGEEDDGNADEGSDS